VDFEPMTLPDFDPAEIDRRDFGEEPPATPFDDEEEYGVGPRSTGGTTPPIPQPRPAEPSTDAGENRTEPALESEPEPEPAGVAAVLPVDDLERSLRFYGETMGFTIAYATSTNAMVESGRTRILLRQGSAQRPARTDHLQLQVADVEARYRDLQSRGVEFPEPPRALSSDDDLELWLARLRDPDGHEIELIEWRQRS
jgi:catechol 2,3-dioxygenase-like lactoylglutathione lyase family enzyme